MIAAKQPTLAVELLILLEFLYGFVGSSCIERRYRKVIVNVRGNPTVKWRRRMALLFIEPHNKYIAL